MESVAGRRNIHPYLPSLVPKLNPNGVTVHSSLLIFSSVPCTLLAENSSGTLSVNIALNARSIRVILLAAVFAERRLNDSGSLNHLDGLDDGGIAAPLFVHVGGRGL